MTYKGIARGRMIELTERLPFPEGQVIEVSINAEPAKPVGGLAGVVRRAMHAPPVLDNDLVDEFERVIREGRLDVRERGVFDAGETE
jgi:hypothetical protein